MSTNVTADVFVYEKTPIDARRGRASSDPVLGIGERFGPCVTLYFENDASARRLAESILALLDTSAAQEIAEETPPAAAQEGT